MAKISVIVPNYNHANYLDRRIQSIINQDFNDFEIIILDDCSTDSSKDIIEKYRSHQRVAHIIYNENNSGSTFKQWDKGISLATGEWILIAESDDVAQPQLLSTLYTASKQRDDVVISYCQSNKIDENNQFQGTWKFWTDDLDADLFSKDFIMDGNEYIKRFLQDRCTILNASAVLFRKHAYTQLQGADTRIRYSADWNLWLKMATLGAISFTASCLNDFRQHSQSVIGQRPPYHKMKYDFISLYYFYEYCIENQLDELRFVIYENAKNRLKNIYIFLQSLDYKDEYTTYESFKHVSLSDKEKSKLIPKAFVLKWLKKIYYLLRYQKQPTFFSRNKISFT